ncbi:MAG TPA: serine hydrolase [Blastocatellia bacterium]|nr:serine hydrolase [Blastocatellia bacterium]
MNVRAFTLPITRPVHRSQTARADWIARLLPVLVICVVTAPACAQDLAAKIDEYMNAQARNRQFSGSILVAQEGQVLIKKGYGLANIEHGVPNSPQTRFRLGSITKQFTAAAILLLQEQGKLDVKDPVCKYLPQCPDAWKEITLHHLLTHTSGIPNFTNFPEYQKTMTSPSPAESTIARFRDKPLDFKPGEKFSYSNSGYIVLGYIVEKVSGKTYAAFLQEKIFEPLKMTSTGYDETARIVSQRAAGYERKGDAVANASYLDMTIPFSAGGLYSTVEDLFTWDQALYGYKLLSKKSLDAMFTPFLGDYAYGWTIGKQFNRNMVGHGGGINGFSTNITRFTDDEVCIVVLSNMVPSTVPAISRDLAAIVFGEKYSLPQLHGRAKIDPKVFDSLVGQYEFRPGFALTISGDGDRLKVAATGRPATDLIPESETEYYIEAVDTRITFVKDERGLVTQLVFHQGGRDTIAKKTR